MRRCRHNLLVYEVIRWWGRGRVRHGDVEQREDALGLLGTLKPVGQVRTQPRPVPVVAGRLAAGAAHLLLPGWLTRHVR